MTHYHWNANAYADNASQQFRWAKELSNKLALCGKESVLDIGCGDGAVSAMLAQQLPDGYVVGVDSSQDMIDHAKAIVSPHYPNISFELMEASALHFKAQFDCVFSNSTLHWVQDHGPVLAGIYAALKPQGNCFLSFGGKGNITQFEPIIDTLINEEKWEPYFQAFSSPWCFPNSEDYEQWVLNAGLFPITVALVPKDMVHTNREGLEGWIRTTWHPYTECLPERLQQDFISALVDRYLEIHPVDQQGRTHVKMVRLEVIAKKR